MSVKNIFGEAFVTVIFDVKVGEIFDPAIAASEATFALLIAPLAIVKAAVLSIVASPLIVLN